MVLSMVLYMVLSDTLADRSMARRQQVRWKGCFTFTYLWLATSWFVSGGCACYLSFRFVLGKERGNSSEKVAKARRKTACIRADTEKMPQKMTATCHTRPQASHHKYKAAGINERQQEHKEPGAKILMNIEARTAGWRSTLSNGAGWISSLSNGAHWRKPNKRRRGRVQKPLFNNHSITAKES